jgi:hypothetical protein
VVKLLAQDSEVWTFVADGETSAAQLRDAYPGLEAAPPHRTLIDLTSATVVRIDLVTMLDLAKRLVEAGRQRLRLSRAALVCSREPDYSRVRAFATAVLLEGLPVRLAVFAERESAKAWLDSGGAAA